jgi:hypothetical protein
METKHTPGPWSYWSGYNPYDKVEAQVTAEDGDVVVASYNHLIAEGEANAKLMAAAPDLLAALIPFLDFADRELDLHGEVIPGLIIEAARKAIAKAIA